MSEFVIVLHGQPDMTLAAHANGGIGQTRAKAKKTQLLRGLAHALTLKKRSRPKWKRATVTYEFYWPDNRRRDEANGIQAMKPAIDGIVVDGGILPDDAWQFLGTAGVRSEIDKENPRTVLIFRKVD